MALGVLLCLLVNCEETASQPEEEAPALSVPPATDRVTYDPAKGAHIVQPEMIKMLGDTLGIVMYESVLEPGDTAAWHEHPYHTVYVLEGGALTVYFGNMEPQLFELPQGVALIQPPLGDMAINTGETPVRLLTHDIYSLDP
ncbi:MAG: hypothetical protein WA952_04235 [Lewinella sp.]